MKVLAKNKNNKYSFHVLKFFIMRHWRPYALIAFLSGILAALIALNMVIIFSMADLILGSQTAIASEQPWMMEFSQYLYRLFPNGLPMIVIGSLLIGLNFFQLMVHGLTQFLIANQSKKIIATYRSKVFEIYKGASYALILSKKAGELLYNVTIPPPKVSKVLRHTSNILLDGLEVLFLVGVLFSLNQLFTGILLSVGSLGYFLLTRFTNRLFYNYSVVQRNTASELNALFSEFITGFKQIRIGNTPTVWKARFEKLNSRLAQVYSDSLFHKSLPGPMAQFFLVLIIVGSAMTLQIIDPESFATNLAFLGVAGLAFLRIVSAMMKLSQHPMEIANSMADVERMYEILHMNVSTPVAGNIPSPKLKESIVLEDVSFTYSGREFLFDEFNLSFNKGAFSAVVGLSGSGKSTLFNLLLGLYKPESGRVLVDGIDLCDIDLATWYEQIGYVSQDVVLFHASVLENIRNFNPQFTETEVVQAARLSFAPEFIMELPDGYQTIIGERGMRLSGGQQQRLSIARAVIHNPNILLFDEATSALDTASERVVQNAIYAAAKGRTVIAIAHRLSTIMHADRIFVLDHGEVIEEGRHSELMDQKGIYTQFVNMQRENDNSLKKSA